MTSRLRNPFKRQDSFSATQAVPSLELNEMRGGGGEALEPSDTKSVEGVEGHNTHATGGQEIDPAALDVKDLDAKDLLENGKERPIEDASDWSSRLISAADNVDESIHSIRMYVVGLAMTCFAAVLGQLFYFRPTSLSVSSLFIVVISFIIIKVWEYVLPSHTRGGVWAWLNPPVNIKEHVAILIMSTTAFSSAMAISVFAADELYYDLAPNYGLCIFTLIGSQFFGYGLAGLSRSICVFPTYAVFPAVIPTVQMFDVLHRDRDLNAQKKRLRYFVIVAVGIFVWSWFPEFIAPSLTGISIVCLARRDSEWITRIFGGSYPNEGFGLFQLCFDWVYISGCSPLYTPLSAQLSLYGGCALCILVTSLCYANNVWNAQNFPFFSQDLYYENGTTYDQSTILNADYSVNATLLAENGLPWYSTSMALYYTGINLACGAVICHIGLWHHKDIVNAWKSFRSRTYTDPHYQKMRVYKEVPMWVYGGIVLASFCIAQATSYTGDSQLPWWAIIVAYLVAGILFPFFVTFPAVTGWQIDTSSLILMLGGAVRPGNTQANMWFTLWGSNASTQGIAFAQDLKIAQYVKLPPRTTLWVQSLGTVVGGIIQIVIMKLVLKNQRDILLDAAGDAHWSGQNVQSWNSQATTWGGFSKEMFAPGKTYEIIPMAILVGLLVPIPTFLLHRKFPKANFHLVITPLVCYGLGFLNAGINSQNFAAVIAGIASQWYARKYRSTWYRKYNFLLSAALDAGIQFFVFISSFAILGAAGTAATMPNWALNPAGYPDYCYYPDSE